MAHVGVIFLSSLLPTNEVSVEVSSWGQRVVGSQRVLLKP